MSKKWYSPKRGLIISVGAAPPSKFLSDYTRDKLFPPRCSCSAKAVDQTLRASKNSKL